MPELPESVFIHCSKLSPLVDFRHSACSGLGTSVVVHNLASLAILQFPKIQTIFTHKYLLQFLRDKPEGLELGSGDGEGLQEV